MTRTGSQNRPYTDFVQLTVLATFRPKTGDAFEMRFNWNDRDSVRRFAAESDKVIRAGGSTVLENKEATNG